MPPYTLKKMAEHGYVMGLATIGEVATHMDLHYDVYFSIENMTAQVNELNALIDGHEDDSIFKYITDEDKARMDDELEAAMYEGPNDEKEARGDETKVEEAQAVEDRDADAGSEHEGAS